MSPTITKILNSGTPKEKRGLFAFDKDTPQKLIQQKFRVWSRWFFPRYFSSKDAPFHQEMDEKNTELYVHGNQFLNIAFRGSAKTTRAKLFIAFAIANDIGHFRRYFKILSKESDNSKQIVTDVYNMLVSKRVRVLCPEIFEKTDVKREETMASFTTATGVKMTASTIGTDQRGDIQEESRPDLIWFDDFETRKSLMSAQVTRSIWLNIDEAITGLAQGGSVVFTANYISERGNVHRLVQKITNKIIVPIEIRGTPTWERFTKEEIARIKESVEDYEGDYLCKPSATKDVYFDRESVDKQVAKEPIDDIAGLKIFRKYDPSHRIGSGHDVGGGVGLDSSTSVFIDFDTFPMQVIATYANNEIKPDVFGHEVARQGKRFGENYVGVEKNYGSTLDILKTIYPTSKIHRTERTGMRVTYQTPTEYGWDSNSATKPKMLSDLAQVLESGLIDLNDKDLIAEVRSYTRGDLFDKEVDPRLTTRHFDLLVACAIALQMNKFVKKPEKPDLSDVWPPPGGVSMIRKSEKPVNPAA